MNIVLMIRRRRCRNLLLCFTVLLAASFLFTYSGALYRLLPRLSSAHHQSEDDDEEYSEEQPLEEIHLRDEDSDVLRNGLIRRKQVEGAPDPGKALKLGKNVKEEDLVLRVEFLRNDTVRPTKRSLVIADADAVRGAMTQAFIDAIREVANEERQVIISVVDFGYSPFALNFRKNCVERLNLTNLLLVCLDKRAVAKLNRHGVACTLFDAGTIVSGDFDGNLVAGSGLGNHQGEGSNMRMGSAASDFGTAGYYRKTNLKTAVVLQALNLGYSTLIADPDIVLFRDPFPYFNCSACDVHFQMDRQAHNSGFAYVRRSLGSRALYATAWNLYARHQRGHDQTYLNMAVRSLRERNVPLQVSELPGRQFLCGVYYFEHAHRMFDNLPACDACVMAHNNYIGSVAAKIYRFRENLLWHIDDGYYSNRSLRYLTYENPVDAFEGVSTMEAEVSALKQALAVATVTGRVLVLPRFHCCSCVPEVPCSHPRHRCSLLSVLRLRTFHSQFKDFYRENSFLRHPAVPSDVTDSVSPVLFVNTTGAAVDRLTNEKRKGVTVLEPENAAGASLDEIQRWLGVYANVTVVRFRSMYGMVAEKEMKEDRRLARLRRRFLDGFQCSEYEQWEKSGLEFVNVDR